MSTMADVYAAAPSAVVLTEGYSLQADLKGYYGTMRFWFAGAHLFGFTSTVSGKPQTITINPGGGLAGIAITRRIPLIHPYITGGNCYADQIQVYPMPGAVAGWDGTAITFDDYFADVHFSTPNYQMETGDTPTVTVQLDSGSERVTRPGSCYAFGDGLRPNHDVGVPVYTIDFSITCHLLDQLDTALYDSLVDCVNATEFFNKPAGTVLYTGPKCQGQYTVGSAPIFDCTHGFKYRSVPHNMIMRPDGGGFDTPTQVAYSGGGPADKQDPEYLHPVDELNQLWGM